MKFPVTTALAATLATTGWSAEPAVFASPETAATLVELFTSEGCSSCPPADAWIGALKTSGDLWKRVVPVVFHVDYWNRLGWPDRFATAAHTARQHRYAAAWRSNSVYTPGFVVNGREWRGWFQREPLPLAAAGKVGVLTLTVRDARAVVAFTKSGPGPAPLLAEVALLGGGIESDVQRGENRGRKLRHEFTVLHHAVAKLRDEGARFTATLDLPGQHADPPVAIAAWITPGEAQAPLQATGGWLGKPPR